jgi:hypothetical protein
MVPVSSSGPRLDSQTRLTPAHFWAWILWETSLLIASRLGLHGGRQSWIMPSSITSSVPTTNADSLEAR